MPSNYSIIPGSGRRYAAPSGVDYGAISRGRPRSFQGGQYGYWDYIGPGSNAKFVPFQQQPTRTPMAVYNPAAYQRNQLIRQQQAAMDEAKRKTEERYEEAMKNLEGIGLQEGKDIDQRFDSSRSAVNQSLVSSGLANTSVLPTMQQGVERERTASRNRLATMLARERNQLLASRNDIPPNLDLYTQLLYRAGAGGI